MLLAYLRSFNRAGGGVRAPPGTSVRPEDSGATTSGRSWCVSVAGTAGVGHARWMPGAGHLETFRLTSSAGKLRTQQAAVPHHARGIPRATFVPHRRDLATHLAVFGHEEIAFTQRVEFPRSLAGVVQRQNISFPS
jgi:hypothetical protein